VISHLQFFRLFSGFQFFSYPDLASGLSATFSTCTSEPQGFCGRDQFKFEREVRISVGQGLCWTSLIIWWIAIIVWYAQKLIRWADESTLFQAEDSHNCTIAQEFELGFSRSTLNEDHILV
jgi:hypothetical protein